MTFSLRSVLTPVLLVGVLAAVGAGTAVANFDFTLGVVHDEPIKVGAVGNEFVRVKCVLTNTGTDADSYDIFKDQSETPITWDVSICVGGGDAGCYAPFVNEVLDALSLSPGATDTVSIYFTPISGEGSGYADLTVRSVGDNGVTQTRTLGCVTDGCDVVFVDDDGGDTVESFYEGAAGVLTTGTWDHSLAGPTEDDLTALNIVWWLTGTDTNTLDADDRTALAGYLGTGGRLALSGQDIAFDLCDVSSPNHSAASQQWFEDWVNATYAGNDSGDLTLVPVPDDPIAQGTTLTLNGGDGANNQTDPDVVTPIIGGGEAWSYSLGGGGAVRAQDEEYRIAFMGFGFEAIDAQSDREQVMVNTIIWLSESQIGVDEQGASPRPVVLERARPNPFNPSVQIPFAIDGASQVSLRIVDAAGRLVRTLVDGRLDAGRHVQSWDGIDDRGVASASGVYFVELRAGDTTQKQKVVMAR